MRTISNKDYRLILGFLIGCTLLSSLCFAAEIPEFITDRPDQTESSTTVPYESVQIEIGWTHSERYDDDIETDVLPETLLRYGIVKNLELRFIYDGYFWDNAVSTRSGAREEEGSGDLAVGLKLKLWNEEGWVPEAALLSHVNMPAGKGLFSSERFDPDYRLAFTHTLSDRISFAYNLGQVWSSEEDAAGNIDTRSEFQYTATLGIDLSNRIGCFAEFFGDIPTVDSNGPANSFDGGFTFLIADDVQFDVSSGVGLSDNADDWFLGAGFSIRFK